VIRPMTEGDFDAVWSIFHDVVATGDSYIFAAETARDAAIAYFFGPGIISRVAERDGQVVGMYKLIPNRIDRGNHVANASFMVAPSASGCGVGRALGEDCLREAKHAGFEAMQFNFVVSTNTAAVTLWQKLGFDIVGTLPRVFRHATLGFVDAYVMHRSLDNVPG
jgi:L-amino acid N-acyltransferase YncA